MRNEILLYLPSTTSFSSCLFRVVQPAISQGYHWRCSRKRISRFRGSGSYAGLAAKYAQLYTTIYHLRHSPQAVHEAGICSAGLDGPSRRSARTAALPYMVFAQSSSPPADHGHPESIDIVLGVFRSLGPPPIPPPPDVVVSICLRSFCLRHNVVYHRQAPRAPASAQKISS